MSAILVQSMGWALLHLLWQATLVAAALALALRLVGPRAAHTRYALACGALLLVAALPVATGARAYARAAEARHVVAPAPLPEPALHVPTVAPRTAVEPSALGPSAEPEAWAGPALRRALSALEAHVHLLVLAWAVGVGAASLRVLLAWRRLRALTRAARPAPLPWQHTLALLCTRLRVWRPVRLLASAEIDVPAAAGWLRPVVLVPVSALTGLPTRQLELVLAHELAHIRRHDFAVNLLQTAVETLLFYHPAVWWISRVIRVEREHCCDDVAADTAGSALSYARALTALEALRGAPEPALSALGGSLPERVRRLVVPGGRCATRWSAGASALTLVASLALCVPLLLSIAPGQAVAQTQAEEATQDVPPALPMMPATVAPSTVTPPAPPSTVTPPGPPSTVTLPAPPSTVVLPVAAPRPVAAARPVEPARPALPALPQPVGSARMPVPPAPLAVPSPAPRAAPAPALPPDAAPVPMPAPRMGLALAQAAPGAPESKADAKRDAKAEAKKDAKADAKKDVKKKDKADDAPANRVTVGPDGAVNLERLDVDDLVAMRTAGLTPERIRELSSLGFSTDVDTLVALGHAGVTTEYARIMSAKLGKSLTADTLVGMRHQGVTPEFVAALAAQGVKVTADDLPGAAAVGVDAAYVKGLGEAGFKGLSLEDLTGMRAVGVTPDYVRALQGMGFKGLDADTVQGLRAVGVTSEYVRELQGLGLKDLDADAVQGLRALGVTADYARGLKSEGVQPLGVEELQELRAMGVTPEFVREMRAAGIGPLDAETLTRLRAGGVDADFVRRMKGGGR